MSYLNALKKATKTKEVPYQKQQPSEFIETDIAQPSDRKKAAQAKYDKLSPSQKRKVDKLIMAKKKSRENSSQAVDVRNQDINNRNQEKMKSMYEYKMAQKKEKAFELEERDQAKRDSRIMKDNLAVMKAQKKASVKEQARRDKIVIDTNKYIMDKDLFAKELEDFTAEQYKNIIPGDKEGKKIIDEAIARKKEVQRIKQKYAMATMMEKLWDKYGNMEDIREYLREAGLENELANL